MTSRATQGKQLTVEGSSFSYGKPHVTIQLQGRFSQLSDSAYDTLQGIVHGEFAQLQSLIDLPNAPQGHGNDSRMLTSGEMMSRTITISDGSEEYSYTITFQVDNTKGTIPAYYAQSLLRNISSSFELWAQTDGSQPVVTEPAFERIRRQNIQEANTASRANEFVGASSGGPGSVQRSRS